MTCEKGKAEFSQCPKAYWLFRWLIPSAPAHLRSELNIEIVLRIASLQGLVSFGYLAASFTAVWYAVVNGQPVIKSLLLALPVLGTSLLTMVYWLRYRNVARPARVSDKAPLRMFRTISLVGAVWGVTLTLMGLDAGINGQLMMLLIACGIAGASVTFLYFLPSAAIGFGILCTTPPAVALAMNGVAEAVSILPVYVAYLAFIIGATFNSYKGFLHNLILRVENQQLLVKAEAANEAKSEFISSVSHELRTPLNAIYGFSQLMTLADEEDEVDPAQVREYAGHIVESAQYLLSLVEDILDASALDSGNVNFESVNFAPADQFDDLLTLVRIPASKKQVSLSIGERADLQIKADPKRFKQVVANYLSNAVKYNRPGGSVELGCNLQQDGRLRIYVRDSGLGIPLEEQGKLFERFGRASHTVGLVEGAGIGLYYAKRLAELMGGQVGFVSEPGVGSTFWVEFAVSQRGD